jgi:hypothetical protein
VRRAAIKVLFLLDLELIEDLRANAGSRGAGVSVAEDWPVQHAYSEQTLQQPSVQPPVKIEAAILARGFLKS